MSPLSVTEAPLLLDFIDAVATAFVLDAAAQLGVINPVARRSQDTSQLVDACATDPSMTALLLERFASSAEDSRCRSPRSPHSRRVALLRAAYHAGKDIVHE